MSVHYVMFKEWHLYELSDAEQSTFPAGVRAGDLCKAIRKAQGLTKSNVSVRVMPNSPPLPPDSLIHKNRVVLAAREPRTYRQPKRTWDGAAAVPAVSACYYYY
jgi:hypothetical protein